jgi:hypothetical protein
MENNIAIYNFKKLSHNLNLNPIKDIDGTYDFGQVYEFQVDKQNFSVIGGLGDI